MALPMTLIKYVLFGIIIIVAGFKLFTFTQQMIKKLKNKSDDIDLDDIEKIEEIGL